MTSRLNILVSAMLGAVPSQGGWVWAVMQYVLGLQRLGHRVFFVEPIPPSNHSANECGELPAAASFRQLTTAFGLTDCCLWVDGTHRTLVGRYEELAKAAREADVFLNLSGRMSDLQLTKRTPFRVYLDLDPAFTQLWQAVQGIDMHFEGHTHFATVGLAIGHDGCRVPTCGREWISTLPPVVLEHWPASEVTTHDAFTTVAHWRGYGSVEHDGVLYGQKAHSLRGLIALPQQTRVPLLLALAIHPDEARDAAALHNNGWRWTDPAGVASTPEQYAAFVRGSRGEFGVAKSGYVASQCGWFSDRSVCYLASGRPVVAQETGFSRFVPTGQGLLSFRNVEDAVRVLEQVQGDYAAHARAARRLAEERFDSDRVLRRLLQMIGATE